MSGIEWLEGNRIKVPKPKRPKKITGTRLAAILGLNKWSTPFRTWCEITRTWEEPFEDTIYTIAGKTIEPKQADYMEKSYLMDIVRPADVYGEDYFHKTFGDFFREQPIFGGMWDYLETENSKVVSVLEMKTSKRVEDWEKDIPEYYAMQAALYAYLMGVDDVIMVASFLKPDDYKHPEDYVPSAENTITREFSVSERYPHFADTIHEAEKWWKDHVLTGVSPAYDEKADAEILAQLRKKTVTPDDDFADILKEADDLKAEIDARNAEMKEKEDRLKVLQDAIKERAKEQFGDGDKQVVLSGSKYVYTLAKSVTEGIDKDRLKADGLYDKYKKSAETYRLTIKERKE